MTDVERQATRPRSLELVDTIARAYTRQDWNTLRALYHDEARIHGVAPGADVVGPDELVESLGSVVGTVYSIGPVTYTPLDDDAVLATAGIRYPHPGGGHANGLRCWLLTFKDGLVWRSRDFHTERDAQAAYAAYGPDLGL